MKTKIVISKIHFIVKTLNSDRIITEVQALDKKQTPMFTHSNPNGIGDNETALRIFKLLQRRNSSFEQYDVKVQPNNTVTYWYWR